MLVSAARDGRMPRSEILPVDLVIGESTPSRGAPGGTDRTGRMAAEAAMVRGA
jgi:hypothetical protein